MTLADDDDCRRRRVGKVTSSMTMSSLARIYLIVLLNALLKLSVELRVAVIFLPYRLCRKVILTVVIDVTAGLSVGGRCAGDIVGKRKTGSLDGAAYVGRAAGAVLGL